MYKPLSGAAKDGGFWEISAPVTWATLSMGKQGFGTTFWDTSRLIEFTTLVIIRVWWKFWIQNYISRTSWVDFWHLEHSRDHTNIISRPVNFFRVKKHDCTSVQSFSFKNKGSPPLNRCPQSPPLNRRPQSPLWTAALNRPFEPPPSIGCSAASDQILKNLVLSIQKCSEYIFWS
jgi:hypothetical protein